MSFVSGAFLIFFAIVLSVTTLLDKFGTKRMREIFLLAASYFFYGYWDWRFCFLLLFVTVTAYITALKRDKKTIYVIGLIVPLIVLGIFKYLNFFLDTASAIVGHKLGTLAIILPVGISFYTFQALSYVVDVKRGSIPAETSFVRLALYISFFPQLVAGPIVRASDFLPQLGQDHKVQRRNVKIGLQIMLFGAIKKLVIADHLSVFVQDVFDAPMAYSWGTLILAAFSCAVQIYMDFSGYSDMAIGCAYCLGYVFKKNFNLPYIAQSFTELWSRWHISMSGWFTEYVFYPLAMRKRNNKYYHLICILFTMFLSGLWHGANWNMILWGCMLGAMLVVEKLMHLHDSKRLVAILPRIAFVLTLNAVFLVFFRSNTIGAAFDYIRGIVTLQKGIHQPYVWTFISIGLCVIGYLSAVYRSKKKEQRAIEGYYPLLNLSTVGGQFIFFMACGCLLLFAYLGENPFVYFQF